jgi:hypothetical protein
VAVPSPLAVLSPFTPPEGNKDPEGTAAAGAGSREGTSGPSIVIEPADADEGGQAAPSSAQDGAEIEEEGSGTAVSSSPGPSEGLTLSEGKGHEEDGGGA